MTLFCNYSHIFGEPKKGIHAQRIGPFGLVDMMITFIIGGLLGYFFISDNIFGIFIGFILFIFFGVFVHYLFCVDTVIKF